MSFSDDSDISLLEQELFSLRPAKPEPHLNLSLERRMTAALSRPTASAPLVQLKEENLASLRPAKPEPHLILSLERRMAGGSARPTASAPVVQPKEENLAPITSFAVPQAKSSSGSWRKIAPWAAAAAVAAASPYLWKQTAVSDQGSNGLAETKHEKLQKVRAERRVQEAREEGVVLDPTHGGIRTIRLQYTNDYEVEDYTGQKLGFQFPSEERLVIPVKVY